jgi:stage II sporulation protein D
MKAQRSLLGALLCTSVLAACVDTDPTSVNTTPAKPQYAIPANWNGNVRIGVVPTATSITLGSNGDYTIRGKTSGAVVLAGNNGSVTVTLTTPLVTKWYVQVICGNAAAAQTLIDKAVALGHPVTTEPCPFGTRVMLGDFLLSQSFTIRNNYRLLVISQGFPSDAFGVSRNVSVATYRLQGAGAPVSSTEIPVVTSSTGLITINGLTYRGAGEVRSNSTGTLAGVNELHIEDYLYGVVPRELGPVAFPEIEAQKAQAVAARTYALANLGKRAVDGYDLQATTADQVYGGYSAEHPVSSDAINATRGMALYYDGALISAMYSSTSGGHTADSEESFSTAVPYLRGVPDAERGQAIEHVPNLEVFKAHANPNALRASKEGDFESDWASRHRWVFEWSADEISDVISAWRGTDVGTVHAINVLERGPSGRVLSIEYVTDAGTFTHTKDLIRSSLRFLNASNVMNNLPSTLFFVEAVEGKKKDGTAAPGFVVYGGGFGHGVGMGQTGAVGMAEKGHTFEEILKHYYRGVELQAAY